MPQAEPRGPRGDPSKPPVNGSCPFKELPPELLRHIFADSLPLKKLVIKPQCEHDGPVKEKGKSPKRNKVSDLMVLCKKFKNEVAASVYQERTFEIHVHESATSGGIEFLDAGRQMLQYLSEDFGIDARFTRFGCGDEFGFDRLKKINIVIFNKTDPRHERHTAMNTYFMNLALAQMLRRGCDEDSDRIVSLNITFKPLRVRLSQQVTNRQAIMRAENPWWDPDKKEPVSSEIHGMSDIELMLRPFSILRQVHNVLIELPAKVKGHTGTVSFIQVLKQAMMGPANGDLPMQDGSFEQKANAIKIDLYQSHIFGDIYGRKGELVDDLNENDMQDLDEQDDTGSPKHALSHSVDGGDSKRRKAFPVSFGSDDEDDDEEPIGNFSDIFIRRGGMGKGKKEKQSLFNFSHFGASETGSMGFSQELEGLGMDYLRRQGRDDLSVADPSTQPTAANNALATDTNLPSTKTSHFASMFGKSFGSGTRSRSADEPKRRSKKSHPDTETDFHGSNSDNDLV